MMPLLVTSCCEADAALQSIIDTDICPDRVFVLADVNTAPLLGNMPLLNERARIITIGAGDEAKNVGSLVKVWSALSEGGASRRSLLVNIGGGMVCDLGGFAAATFKRGIRCVNLPTSLLAMVDASVGGKTGINLANLKNEVGAFVDPAAVICAVEFLATLPTAELLSGYAEMLKHGIIDSPEMFYALVSTDPLQLTLNREAPLLIARNVAVKERIVGEDPKEQGLRKTLNLGHTVGHAIESWCLGHASPVPHGYAVVWGLVVEAVLGRLICKDADSDMVYALARFVGEHYGSFPVGCDHYDDLLALMTHDKKNPGNGQINFTLPMAPGRVTIDNIASATDIKASLDIARDLLGS